MQADWKVRMEREGDFERTRRARTWNYDFTDVGGKIDLLIDR